ncbi:MAG: 2-C-methyl-D-erythritol 4-phosphate cytidylyltransferase [Bacteroidales bacterium]|nr:2-C-methyl-D-erythritol 4-phosphate cytidylyltransferase [Bacteroidales bacterium]
MRRNVAVVLAAGVGSRFGASCPKQFLQVNGRMIVEYTISVFEHHPGIDEIAVVTSLASMAMFEEMRARNAWEKVTRLLSGGKERSDSSLAALQAYANEDVNLIIHDGVRPLVSERIITDVVEALRGHEAVTVAVPVTDTIYEVENGCVKYIPDRHVLQKAQTPQAFRVELLREAFRRGMDDPDFKVTDDCGVVRQYVPEQRVYIVRGEERNMKITYPEDLVIFEQQLNNRYGNNH